MSFPSYLWLLASKAFKNLKGISAAFMTVGGLVLSFFDVPIDIQISEQGSLILRLIAIAAFPFFMLHEGYLLYIAEMKKNEPAFKWDQLNAGVQAAAEIAGRGKFIRDAFSQNNDPASRQRYAAEMVDLGARARIVVEQHFPKSELAKFDGATIKAGVEYPEQALFSRQLVLLNEIIDLGRDRLKNMQR